MSLRPTDSEWNDLRCDAGGCDARLDGHKPGLALQALQSIARSKGWLCAAERDLCPAHNPKPRGNLAEAASWLGRPARRRRRGGEVSRG